ncbi:CAAD domain-containing protein [Candidatus Synechococcus spongiarum]|uniref:Cyanobacterial aminoacyl-tRNA synthetase CAAD domain-containing protein n=1 Tax=Candidatus Synechococcus spongiarum TaxID=431041 RepID=A0A164Y1F1_9SYNE|nr:CAAD domain-containing protein [Candidatus Synechococcus spongiarum]SAY38426.1 hypothetical protein FLM9_284 [Candidatus Synechococcus spongiarum]
MQDTKDMPEQAKGTSQSPDSTSATPAQQASQQAEGSSEGGEFQLLLNLVQGWVDRQGWNLSLKRLGQPIRNLFLLIAALMVFQLVSGVAEALNRIPLLGNTLMLVALVQITIFTRHNLLRQADRQNLRKRINTLLDDTFG